MRAEAKMVEIPTCGVVKCGAWSIEAGGASNMQPPFFISHFIFFILYFPFPILDSRGSAPSGRLHNGNWGISVRHPIGVWVACLSTDRRADIPDLNPAQPGRLHASPHCRFVKLSGLGRRAPSQVAHPFRGRPQKKKASASFPTPGSDAEAFVV